MEEFQASKQIKPHITKPRERGGADDFYILIVSVVCDDCESLEAVIKCTSSVKRPTSDAAYLSSSII